MEIGDIRLSMDGSTADKEMREGLKVSGSLWDEEINQRDSIHWIMARYLKGVSFLRCVLSLCLGNGPGFAKTGLTHPLIPRQAS